MVSKIAAYLALVMSVLALSLAVGAYQAKTQFSPDVAKWLEQQYDKNSIVVKAAEVIRDEKAKAQKAQEELNAIRAELDALKAKGK